MVSTYRILLSLHLIAVISWMAGVLYLYRLFVYHAQETNEVVKERFVVMEYRLYRYITAPAMYIAMVLGISMLVYNPNLLKFGWMHAKLFFAFCMIGITQMAGPFHRKLKAGTSTIPHKTFRILNEVPTILMIGIILMAILQPF